MINEPSRKKPNDEEHFCFTKVPTKKNPPTRIKMRTRTFVVTAFFAWLWLVIVAVAAKPKCILHIGPHKTGSTSLQSMLCDYKTKLNQDGFVFPQGMRSEHGRKHFKSCPKNMASVAIDLRANYTGPWDDITTTWKGWQPTIRHQSFGNAGVHTGFEQFLNHAEQKNHSIVVSAEEFDRPGVDCKILKRWLRPFDTTVVVGYRPFFDFLLSIHKEIKARQLDPHHITFVQWLPTAIDNISQPFISQPFFFLFSIIHLVPKVIASILKRKRYNPPRPQTPSSASLTHCSHSINQTLHTTGDRTPYLACRLHLCDKTAAQQYVTVERLFFSFSFLCVFFSSLSPRLSCLSYLNVICLIAMGWEFAFSI